MSCIECSSSELTYQISFREEEHIKLMPTLINHFQRHKCWVSQDDDILLLKEHSIPDLLDFCQDHIQSDSIYFRIGEREWRPFAEIGATLEAQWIDSIISKASVMPFYQPIVDPKGNVFAHEILTRAIAEDGTLISPGNLFNAAKHRNRIYALDKLCRTTAVRNAIPNQKFFVNFLPTSIYSPEHCLKTTMAAVHAVGVNPSNIVFEVVETEKVDDIDHLKSILLYYKKHGFEYALDDVGEGYSTLELLKELAPNYMKLDMKYVQGVSKDSQKQEMAKRALSIALELDIIPLAEGIDEKSDFEFLRDAGFRLFQGYLFGKPAPNLCFKDNPQSVIVNP